MSPSEKTNEWLANESTLGCDAPNRMVLATTSSQHQPRSRVVAIREINSEGILFFTQRNTRKYLDLKANPSASMTLWLPLQQREVIIDGRVEFLTQDENQYYWNTMTQERQLMFASYAPTSGQVIASNEVLTAKYKKLQLQYEDDRVPLCEFYCGIRLVPQTFIFYTLGVNDFSSVEKYSLHDEQWQMETLSP